MRKNHKQNENEKENQHGSPHKTIKLASILLLVILIIFGIIMGIQKYNQDLSYNAKRLKLLDSSTINENSDEVYADEGKHVKFIAYFTKANESSEYADLVLETDNEVKKSAAMYINLGIENGGTLEDGRIIVNGKNFTYKMQMIKDSVLSKNYISDDIKEIVLNHEVSSGTNENLFGEIKAKIPNPDSYSQINEITLKGYWVSDDKTERVEIDKTIELKVDWHGTATTQIVAPYTTVKLKEYKEKKDKAITFDFTVNEIQKKLIVQKNVVKITIPDMFGEHPTTVTCKNSGVISEYDDETQVLTIEKNTNTYTNTYKIELTYPETAIEQLYTGYTLNVPIVSNYQCYNNPNSPYMNPYITATAIASKTIMFKQQSTSSYKEYVYDCEILESEYVTVPTARDVLSKQQIINSYDNPATENMKYTVLWRMQRTEKESTSDVGIIFNEIEKNGENYGETWDGTVISDYISNTGIYFKNENFISETGAVKIYDNDTDTLIKTFTYEEINEYNTANNAYKYDAPIKHIRVETSEGNPNSGAYIDIYSKKEVDVKKITEDYTKQEIEQIVEFRTSVHAELTNGKTDNLYVSYGFISESSYATLSMSDNTLNTTEPNPVSKTITINVPEKAASYANWQNGIYLMEVPSQIVYMTIDEITADNSNITISGYELIKQNEKYLLKIVTNNNTPRSNFKIDIKTKMLVNPTTSLTTGKMILYAYNPYYNTYIYETKDIYDVNSNENTEDMVGYATVDLNYRTTNSFVSMETITNYNELEEMNIPPNIAEVSVAKNTAVVNVGIMNYFTNNTVEDVVIIGKIPFEGNTYITGGALNSKFDTTIIEGFTVPDNLKNNAKIYYSTNTQPETYDPKSTNIENYLTTNNFISEDNITDFTGVKSYLIVLENYKMESKETYTFSYKIEMPSNATLNDISYGCHSVYYSQNTNDGKLALSVHPNKVGLRVVDYYDFNVMKYKKDTKLEIAGAQYELAEVNDETNDDEDDEKTRILTSTSSGELHLEDLRVNQIYSFKEIQAPTAYELNEEIVLFKVTKNTNGELELVIVSNTKNETEEYFEQNATLNKASTEDKYTLASEVEDTPKYALNITKLDENTNQPMSNVQFKINGKTYTTQNGKVIIENLKINEEYTLEEIYSRGYYLLDNITFTLVQDSNGNLEMVSDNSIFNGLMPTSDETEDLMQVDVTLTNKPIPTYNLKIVKVNESNTETVLEGATFLLKRTDLNNSEYFTTDSNGIIDVSDLYEYEPDENENRAKKITGKYSLIETTAPSGYVNNREEIVFEVSKVNGKLVATVENMESLETINNIEEDGNTLIITIQDKPLFELLKQDEETEEPLADAQFIIYELDENGDIKDYAKDENGNYIGIPNENGDYIVKTNDSGNITQSFENGNYKIIELKAPEGYENNLYSQAFSISGNKADEDNIIEVPEVDYSYTTYENNLEATLEIDSIEDLVDFSNRVNNGETFEGQKVVLTKDLDFESSSSYENLNDDYFDNDEVSNAIKEELTNKSGPGFTPIGVDLDHVFSGVFDGQNHEIKNLYIDCTGDNASSSYTGFFGTTKNAKILNLSVSGTVKRKNIYSWNLWKSRGIHIYRKL